MTACCTDSGAARGLLVIAFARFKKDISPSLSIKISELIVALALKRNAL